MVSALAYIDAVFVDYPEIPYRNLKFIYTNQKINVKEIPIMR